MKFLLTVYICSAMSGECYTNTDFPKVFPDHHDCIRAGLSESYEIIYAEGNFTKKDIMPGETYRQPQKLRFYFTFIFVRYTSKFRI